jgi:hypothetical protein
MLGENFLEQVGGITPERWADLDRNGGRHHLGIVGGFRPESAAAHLSRASAEASPPKQPWKAGQPVVSDDPAWLTFREAAALAGAP